MRVALRVDRLEPAHHLEHARPGHAHIEQQHIRPEGGTDVDRLVAVCSLAQHLDVGVLRDDRLQALPDNRMIVGDHESNGRSGWSHGILGSSCVHVGPRL